MQFPNTKAIVPVIRGGERISDAGVSTKMLAMLQGNQWATRACSYHRTTQRERTECVPNAKDSVSSGPENRLD
jgi:hypothetical protein